VSLVEVEAQELCVTKTPPFRYKATRRTEGVLLGADLGIEEGSVEREVIRVVVIVEE
jgi:hypothetical protein